MEVGGLKINYKTFGKGKPFLILHGWGSNLGKWSEVAELLSGEGFMVIIPDMPGFGQSEAPKSVWGIDDYVEFVKDFLDSFKEFDGEFHLLGHSFGGAVSVKFSIKYPQKVRKLFLAAPALIRKKKNANTFFYKFSKAAKGLSFLPFYRSLRSFFYRYLIRKTDYLKTSGIMKEIFSKIVSEDVSHLLPTLKTPTIIFWGTGDKLTPIGESKIIKEKIGDSKLLLFTGIGHSLHLEMPKILAKEILTNK